VGKKEKVGPFLFFHPGQRGKVKRVEKGEEKNAFLTVGIIL